MKATYNVLFPALSEAYPEVFVENAFSWDAYLWGHTTVATRLFPSSFSVPNNKNAETVPSSVEVPGSAKEAMVPSGCLILVLI